MQVARAALGWGAHAVVHLTSARAWLAALRYSSRFAPARASRLPPRQVLPS